MLEPFKRRMHVLSCKYCFYSSSLELNAGQSAFKYAAILDDAMIAGIGTIGIPYIVRKHEQWTVGCSSGAVRDRIDFVDMASVGPAKEPRSVMTCWNDQKKFNKITFAPRGKYNK